MMLEGEVVGRLEGRGLKGFKRLEGREAWGCKGEALQGVRSGFGERVSASSEREMAANTMRTPADPPRKRATRRGREEAEGAIMFRWERGDCINLGPTRGMNFMNISPKPLRGLIDDSYFSWGILFCSSVIVAGVLADAGLPFTACSFATIALFVFVRVWFKYLA